MSLKRKNNNVNLLKAISFLRLQLTYEELGEKLGYTKGTVSKYLSKKNPLPPSDDFLNKFEEVFDIKLSDFETSQAEIKNPQQNNDESLKDKMIEILQDQLRWMKNSLDRANDEIDRMKNK